jgi:hypothetical protein
LKGKKSDTKPADEFLKRFSSSLRLRDKEVADALTELIKSRIDSLHSREKSMDELISVLGRPEDLARTLSDPTNWVIEMGTPLNPGVPIKSFLSTTGRNMLLAVFILALILSAVLVVSGTVELIYPVVISISIALWAILISWFTQFLGFISAYAELREGSLPVNAPSRDRFRRSVLSSVLFLFLVSTLLALSPFLGEREGFVISIPAGFISFFAVIIMGLMIWKESSKIDEK